MDSRNKTKTRFIFLTAVLLTAFNTFAQDSPVVSKGNLQFYIDNASFMGKENKTYTEFYLMLFSDQLISAGNDRDTVKELVIKSSIINPDDERIVTDKQWTTNALLPRDSSSPNNTVIYDQWAEFLSPGTYNVNVTIEAGNPEISGKAEFSIDVPKFNNNTFSISQIEFVSEVKKESTKTPFTKGSQAVIPNPWRRYGALNSRLSFFYEIYNLPVGSNLTGEYILTNNAGETVKKLSGIKYGNSTENASIVHGINISRLPTGTYDLNIIIKDSGDGNSFTKSRTFEVIRLDSITQNVGLTAEEAEIEGGIIKYIGTPGQYNFYESLDLTGKTRYVINFWAKRTLLPERWKMSISKR